MSCKTNGQNWSKFGTRGTWFNELLDMAALAIPGMVGWSGTLDKKMSRWFLKRAKSPEFSMKKKWDVRVVLSSMRKAHQNKTKLKHSPPHPTPPQLPRPQRGVFRFKKKNQICLSVPKLWIWVHRGLGRCLMVILQTRAAENFRSCQWGAERRV